VGAFSGGSQVVGTDETYLALGYDILRSDDHENGLAMIIQGEEG